VFPTCYGRWPPRVTVFWTI